MNFWTVIVGAIAMFVGYKLNQRANEQTEKRIIAAFTAEIEKLKAQQQSGTRTTGTEQGQIEGLEKALELIKKK